MHALHLVVDFALVGTVPHPRDEAVQLHDDEGEEVFLRHKMHQPDEWMREKKKSRFTKIFWYLNRSLLRKRGTKYQLNCNLEKPELKILE